MLNYGNYVFEIPVYRLDEKKHYIELDKIVIKSSMPIEHYKLYFPEKYSEEHQKHLSRRRERIYSQWKYNEIIGWIGIYFLSTQLRGEFSYVEEKRIVKSNKKKEIIWMGDLFEVSLDEIDSSEDIFDLLKIEIEDIKKKTLFKNRFIDTSLLYKTGSFIDWMKLKNNRHIMEG